MNATDLRELFTKHVNANGQLVLNAALLPEAGVIANYIDPDAGDAAKIVIEDAVVDPDAVPATVTGKATFLNVKNMQVTLTGKGDDATTSLRLEATEIPDSWKFTDSFKNVPKYWASVPGEFGWMLRDSFFGDVKLKDVAFVLSNADADDRDEKSGLNLSGKLSLDAGFADGLAVKVLQWIKGGEPLDVRGTVQLAKEKKPPTIDLRAELDPTLTFELGSFKLVKAFIWLRTVEPRGMDEPVSRMELAGTISIGSPKPMSMTISTELVADASGFVFVGESEDQSFSLGNGLTDIAAVLGVPTGSLSLPPGLERFSTLYIRQIALSVTAPEIGLEYVSLTLALPLDPPWATPIPKFAIREVETEWTAYFGGDKSIEGVVSGVFRIGEAKPVDIGLEAEFPNFRIIGRLEDDSPNPISITDAIRSFVDVPGLPEINISELALEAEPSKGNFSIGGTLESDWSVPIGTLTSFAITSVYFTVNRSGESGFSGTVGGQAKLGSATFDANYDFPGNNFVIGGKVPELRLGELISTLTSTPLELPDGIDFTLKDSETAITKKDSDYTFFVQTKIENVGTMFFQILRAEESGWGVAVGVDLTVVQRIGDLRGFEFMNAIDLTFTRLALVLSTVDLPSGYTFPTLQSYKSTAPADTKKLKVPSGIGKPKRGINFYAQFAFGDRAATNDQALVKLYDFFSIQRVDLDVALQVAWSKGKFSALLLAGTSVTAEYGIGGKSDKHNMEFAAYLAVEYKDGSAALFLRGLLKLDAPGGSKDEKLTFAMEMGLQPHGFYVAGSMSGAWRNPFGIEGLTVSDVGLMLGVTWEGVPAVGFAGTITAMNFQGSLACIVNSVDPKNSILAGSISQLTVGDIVNTFVGVVVQPDPGAKEIIAVLNNIGVEGINPFTLPISLVEALDGVDLEKVVATFNQSTGAKLTPKPESTMLIVGEQGNSWFLTDKTNGVVHYQIKRDGNQLQGWKQAQLYLSPSDTRIASLEFPQGYRIYGQLNIFGFKQSTDVTILINKGIGAEVRMSEVNLFGGLLRLQRAPGDTLGKDGGNDDDNLNGPYVSIATYSRDSRTYKAPYNTPHFFVSGALSFLGLVEQVMDIAVTENGIHVVVKRKLFGTEFDFCFDFKMSPLSLAGSGTAAVDLSPKIDLSAFGLGVLHILDAKFSANLTFGVNAEKLFARASGDFYFSIPGLGVRLGPYHLDLELVNIDQPLAKLQKLFEEALQRLGNLVQDVANKLLADAKAFAKLVEQGVITVVGSLDDVLKKVFNISLADLYATTQCFAGSRLGPHLMRPALMPYTPAPGENFSAAPPASANDPLAQLRALRADLGDSAMGKWVLNIYNTLSEPLVHLYDFKPTDPDHPTFKDVLDAYNGYAVFNDLLKLLQSAGSSKPFCVTQEFLDNGQQLVAAIIDLADMYSQTGDPQREKEGELIVTGISSLLEHISLIEQLQGLNYEQIKTKIRSMTPPPSPWKT